MTGNDTPRVLKKLFGPKFVSDNFSLAPEICKQTLRELLFRLHCSHKQGSKPNILLFCTRRSGSTWLLNTLATQSGLRYVNRPFMSVLESRRRWSMPDPRSTLTKIDVPRPRQLVGFPPQQEELLEHAAGNIINGNWVIYPSLNFKAPYFNRKTDRIALQMTSCLPMIDWFDEKFDVHLIYLVRHPITNALSIMNRGWPPETFEFLYHESYMSSHFNDEQTAFAFDVEAKGTLLERHVLDWCLKNKVPIEAAINNRIPGMLCLSYENLVLNREEILTWIADQTQLTCTSALLDQAKMPSRTVTDATATKVSNIDYLLSRWRDEVTVAEERRAMNILERMEIDLYQVGRNTPMSSLF